VVYTCENRLVFIMCSVATTSHKVSSSTRWHFAFGAIHICSV